jgi:hypothetical protein
MAPLTGAALMGTLSWTPLVIAATGDLTLAETLFRDGKAAMKVGDYVRGCPKLAESYRQDPTSGTLLALAYCQEQAGKTASAWGTYNAVIVRAGQERRGDREKIARERAAWLEDRLSKLVVDVPPAVASLRGIAVKLDGEVLPSAAWGSAMPIDPGDHLVEATADGMQPWHRQVSVGTSNDREVVRVNELKTVISTPTPTTPKRVDSPATSFPHRLLGVTLTGTGLLAVGVGIGFAMKAKGLDTDSKRDGHCDEASGCDDRGYALNQDALAAARVASVLCAAGGTLALGGVVLYFVPRRPSSPERMSLRVSPLGQTGASVQLRAGF